jgi:hypothetical protein
MSVLFGRRQIEIAHRFYEAREALRSLWGESYSEKIEPWKAEVLRIAKQYENGVVMKAALPICVALKKENDSGGILAVLAACVELIEPAA